MHKELKTRYKLIIAYNGTAYCGFQKLSHHKTIMGEIEIALNKIDPTINKITACSRTDKGVHAYFQVVSFQSDRNIIPSIWKRALNGMLPLDIRVRQVNKVATDFHPRFNVRDKQYDYIINVGQYNLFEKDLIWQLCRPLKIKELKQALRLFIGQHNFAAFTTDNEKTRNTLIKEIYNIKVKEKNNKITISFIGKGFLRGQIRMLVGAAVWLALTKTTLEQLKNFLNYNGVKWTYKAPACGLYLMKVRYQKTITNNKNVLD